MPLARLSVSPVEPERAYLAAYEAGVYKTNDGIVTWCHLTSYPTDYAHSVLAHPEQPGVLFAGSEPAAVFRSDDGGESWSECNGFRQANHSNRWTFHGDRVSHVRELRTAPGGSSAIFAGVEVGGVIKSTDEGKTSNQLDGLNDDIHLVDISRANPQRIYVATAQAPYRSDDGGEN